MPIARRPFRATLVALLLAGGLTGAGAASAGPAQAAAAPSSGCAQVQLIALRGTTEPGTVGSTLQALTTLVTRDTSRTVLTYGLPYAASEDFVQSVDGGVSLLVQRLAASAQACPSQRFVLAGYSQGAWVIGDALAGGGGGAAPQITPDLGSRVQAVVFWGDPRLVAGEPFLAGSPAAGVGGVLPRDKGALASYAGRIRSYCAHDDTICQRGASGQGHFHYAETQTRDAAAFVVAELKRPVAAPVAAAPGAAGPTISAAQAQAAASAAFAGSAEPSATPTAAPVPAPTAAPAPAAVPATVSQPDRYPHRTWWRLLIGWNKLAF